MVEQWTHKPLVGGSNPPLAMIMKYEVVKTLKLEGFFRKAGYFY